MTPARKQAIAYQLGFVAIVIGSYITHTKPDMIDFAATIATLVLWHFIGRRVISIIAQSVSRPTPTQHDERAGGPPTNPHDPGNT